MALEAHAVFLSRHRNFLQELDSPAVELHSVVEVAAAAVVVAAA